MSVPSNLIPTRISQLPVDPSPSLESWLMVNHGGVTYQVQAGDLVAVSGVPTSRQVIAGTGLTGGGALSANVTLSIANGGVGTTQLSSTGVTAGEYGSSSEVPVVTVDSKGRVTSITTAALSTSGLVPNTRQVIAGNGLTGGGALNANVTLAVDYSATTPSALNNTGNAGVATTVARSDHKHPAVDLGVDTQVDGVLGLSNGGTGGSLTPVAGGFVWSGADHLYVGTAGEAGQVLVSGGTGAYSWGSAFIISDQAANLVYAGPASGPPGPTSFRSIVAADLPEIPFTQITDTPTTLAGYGITDAQPLDSDLTAIAGLSHADGNVIVGDGLSWVAESGSTARASLGAAASGANADITSMTALNGGVGNPTYLQMGDGSAVALNPGRMWYDATTGSFNMGMGGGSITQQVGEEIFIYGKASAAITEGQLIIRDGAVGASGVIKFKPSATGLTNSEVIIGIATENISLHAFGRITAFGIIHGLDTTGSSVGETWASGDLLWYNPNYTGGLTNIKPNAPNQKTACAVVIHAGSGGSGSIQIQITHGSTLGGTDSNVQFGTLSNGDLIQYDSALGYWKNVTTSTITTGKATNLVGGAASKLVYQTAADTTGFIANGTAGQILTSNGASAPSWGSVSGGTF